MKSTNNPIPQFWGKRKPMTHYFKHGFIKFNVRRADKELFCVIKAYTGEDHKTLSELYRKNVESEDTLNRLLSVKSLDEIPYRKEIEN